MKMVHISDKPYYTNSFLLVADNGEAAIIDPATNADIYEAALAENGGTLKYILCTHGHYDHVRSLHELREKTGATVVLSKCDAKKKHLFPIDVADIDAEPQDGEDISFGDVTLHVIATPGHTLGGVCYLCGDLLFAGDTLFAGDIGRCDLEDGSLATMKKSLAKLAAAVTTDAKVLPGHNGFSTMDKEKATNPYLRETV